MEAITASVALPNRDIVLAASTPHHLVGDLLTWKHYARANTLPPGHPRRQVRQPGYRELAAAHASKAMLANAASLWRSPEPTFERLGRTGAHEIIITGERMASERITLVRETADGVQVVPLTPEEVYR